MIASYNLKEDLNEAIEMIKNLETYLRGEELYGLSGSSAFSGLPRLTLGSLLFRLRRLTALYATLDNEMRMQVHQMALRHDRLRDQWRVHYVNKLSHEVRARVHMLNNYLNECDEDLKACAEMFETELTRRTIVQEVLRELTLLNVQHDDARDEVQKLDQRLSQITKTMGRFRWEANLQQVYPHDEFWWLYTDLELDEEY